jgi:hypothetical protein
LAKESNNALAGKENEKIKAESLKNPLAWLIKSKINTINKIAVSRS